MNVFECRIALSYMTWTKAMYGNFTLDEVETQHEDSAAVMHNSSTECP